MQIRDFFRRLSFFGLLLVSGALFCAQLSAQDASELEESFRNWDRNTDQYLQLAEYLKQLPKDQHERQRRSFFERDLDGNLKLTLEEFSLPPDKRTPHWKSKFAACDLDQDGRISREEYIRPFLGSKWEEGIRKNAVHFDRDQDGYFTISEYIFSADSKHTDQQRFDFLDTNDNKRLSLKEYFQSCNGLNHKALRSAFYRQDTEVDLQLSIEEYLVSLKDLPQTNRSRFVDRDTNEDGNVSRKEYIEFEQAYQNRTSDMVAYKKRLTNIDKNLEIVDQDNDGLLSFNEFLKMQKNPAARIGRISHQQGLPEEAPGRFIKLLWTGLTLLFAR